MRQGNIAIFALLAFVSVATNAAVTVKGQVRLLTLPSPLEYAESYADSSELWIRQAMHDLKMRQRNAGIDVAFVPVGAIVELQTLPDFKVIAKMKVNKDGFYGFNVKDDDRDWRVYCKCELEEFGKKVEFSASAHVEWSKHENAYVQDLYLRRDYVSVVGRCVDTNGMPAVNMVVGVSLIAPPLETSETLHQAHVARTDKNGYWSVDGVEMPIFDRLISYVSNTNVISIFDSSCPPYQISVGARTKYFATKGPKADVVVPNVSADARAAVEKFFAAYKRKTGKDYPCQHPLTAFPVSTNNVIYIPDLVVK